MKNILLYIIGLVLVVSCNTGDSVTIKGDLQGFDEGELYFYQPFGNSTQVDTVKVKRGQFTYDTEVKGEAPVIIQFSSSAELPVFAKGGSTVTVKGNVADMQNMEVKGGEANKEMAAFKTDINKTPGQTNTLVSQFIKSHPQSIVSVYLLYKYYLQTLPERVSEAGQLLPALRKGQPGNLYLKRIESQLKEYRLGIAGQKIPAFRTLTADKKVITQANYRGKYWLLIFGASWTSGGSSPLYSIATAFSETHKTLPVLYVSLDVTSGMASSMPADLHATVANEPLVWDSPMVRDFHVMTVPDILLISPDGKISARGMNIDALKAKIQTLP